SLFSETGIVFFLFTGSIEIAPADLADSRRVAENSPADLSDVAIAKSDLSDSRRPNLKLDDTNMVPGAMIWRPGGGGLVWIS
ncbi:MAG TPA: hypothetical protein VK517_02370, partial [Cyclobacteriaceae bacterium]|nr:hypothetical protein [Cyclobacteriaceae bacterium]